MKRYVFPLLLAALLLSPASLCSCRGKKDKKLPPPLSLSFVRTWGGASRDTIWSLAVDSGGDVYLGGQTASYTGAWQVITTGTESSPSGTQSTPSGSESTPAGTESSPTGTEGSPTGSETGAGDYDTLLLRNW